jgi:hypothetical protein
LRTPSAHRRSRFSFSDEHADARRSALRILKSYTTSDDIRIPERIELGAPENSGYADQYSVFRR